MINNRQNNRRRGGGGGPRPNGANPGNDRGNRIDNRARGNASQLYEKYKTLARDAQMQSDRVMSEYYFQFADHYFRVLSESRSRFEEQNRGRPDQGDRDDQMDDGDESDIVGDGPVQRYDRDYSRQQGEARQQNDSRQRGNWTNAEEQPQAEPAPREARSNGVNGHGAAAPEETPAAEAPRRSRTRRPTARREEKELDLQQDQKRAPAEETKIEIDRLPPAFTAPDEDAPVEKPKRRGRPPRVQPATEA